MPVVAATWGDMAFLVYLLGAVVVGTLVQVLYHRWKRQTSATHPFWVPNDTFGCLTVVLLVVGFVAIYRSDPIGEMLKRTALADPPASDAGDLDALEHYPGQTRYLERISPRGPVAPAESPPLAEAGDSIAADDPLAHVLRALRTEPETKWNDGPVVVRSWHMDQVVVASAQWVETAIFADDRESVLVRTKSGSEDEITRLLVRSGSATPSEPRVVKDRWGRYCALAIFIGRNFSREHLRLKLKEGSPLTVAIKKFPLVGK